MRVLFFAYVSDIFQITGEILLKNYSADILYKFQNYWLFCFQDITEGNLWYYSEYKVAHFNW